MSSCCRHQWHSVLGTANKFLSWFLFSYKHAYLHLISTNANKANPPAHGQTLFNVTVELGQRLGVSQKGARVPNMAADRRHR